MKKETESKGTAKFRKYYFPPPIIKKTTKEIRKRSPYAPSRPHVQ